MKLLNNSSRTEKTIFWTSAALMLLALLLFVNEGWYSRFTGTDDGSSSVALGDLGFHKNDVRYKRGRRFDWEKSNESQKIYLGDSVFVGSNSKASIHLDGKNDLHLGENSLVRFTNYKGMTLSDLIAGNFRLQVNGQVQVAINGKVTTLDGVNGSEVQVFFDEKNKPKLKLIKGNVKVATVSKKASKPEAKKLEPKVEIALSLEEPAPSYYFPPEPQISQALVRYNWKLHDLYQRDGTGLKFRTDRPEKLSETYPLAWKDPQPGPYFVEYGTSETFAPKSTSRLTASVRSTKLDQVVLGENYWRVSRDEKEWSPSQKFNVVTGFNGEAPRFENDEIPVWLVNEEAPIVKINWPTSENYTGYVLEGSKVESFPTDNTQVYWRSKPGWQGTFKSAGTYYFRLRAVNAKMELTEYGSTLKLKVEVPPLLSMPLLTDSDHEFVKGDPVDISWTGLSGARAYTVKVTDSKGRSVVQRKLGRPSIELDQLPAGKFKYQVTAIDEWGRAGQSSAFKSFAIKPQPPPKLEPPRFVASEMIEEPTPEPEPVRSAETKAQIKIDKIVQDALDYNSSFVQLEGASAAVISSEQITYGRDIPLLGTVALRGLLWKDNLGLEGSAKMKAFGYNSASEDTSPLQLEARAHARWVFPWRWFSFLREMQASVLGGVELYRNGKGGSLYSNGYELVKMGVNLKFPLGKDWDTGGELVYGLGLDTSTKYEASGHLSYRFHSQWALGVGYRVHYFDAGSTRSAPYILPYREAQGEGFSVLRYSY